MKSHIVTVALEIWADDAHQAASACAATLQESAHLMTYVVTNALGEHESVDLATEQDNQERCDWFGVGPLMARLDEILATERAHSGGTM